MFFTKEFVMDEILTARKLVEEVQEKSVNSTLSKQAGFLVQTHNSEKLQKVLFKLDVIHNAVANVRTN